MVRSLRQLGVSLSSLFEGARSQHSVLSSQISPNNHLFFHLFIFIIIIIIYLFILDRYIGCSHPHPKLIILKNQIIIIIITPGSKLKATHNCNMMSSGRALGRSILLTTGMTFKPAFLARS
jgi:hypothetical protein